MIPRSISTWVNARRNVTPSAPGPPPMISEPRWASLLYIWICEVLFFLLAFHSPAEIFSGMWLWAGCRHRFHSDAQNLPGLQGETVSSPPRIYWGLVFSHLPPHSLLDETALKEAVEDFDQSVLKLLTYTTRKFG